MMKLFLLTLFMAFQVFSQMGEPKNRLLPPRVSNQKGLAKYRLPKYLLELPKTLKSCAGHYLKGSNFHWLRKVAGNDVFSKVFKYNGYKKLPSTDNQFSFGYGSISEVCKREYGYCYGHTASLLLWNRMAFFDKKNAFGHQVPKEKFSESWHNFYFKLIDKIMHKRETVVIPGYDNLYEFSKASPHIKRYLKEHIALTWANKNINFSGLFKIFRSIYNKFDAKEAINLHRNLKQKIQDGYNPIVFVTSENAIKNSIKLPNNAGIHVMQAYKVSEIDTDGNFKVYFWDVGTPHDARDSEAIYEIATKPKSEEQKIQISRVDGTQGSEFDKRKAGSPTDNYYFSDIEQVPFDDLEVGDDAIRMLNFFNENPSFVKNYLEPEHQKRLTIKKRPFFPKYEDSMDMIPSLILKDGKGWKWERDFINIDGELHIDEYFIESIPDQVEEVLTVLDKDWKTKRTLLPDLQEPTSFFYTTEKDPFQSEFSWPRKWVQFDGSIKLPADYKQDVDEKFLDFINESFLSFQPEKFTNPTYLAPDMRTVNISENEKALLKMDFIDNDGYLNIPKKLLPQLNPKILKYLKDSKLWPLKTKIKVTQLNEGTAFRSLGQSWKIPLNYYTQDGKIRIPTGASETWPKWVKEAFCGYGPNAKCLDEYYVGGIEDFILKIPTGKSNEVMEFMIPLSWSPIHTYPEIDPYSFIVTLNIPDDQIEYIPQAFKDIIVGAGGTFPPSNKRFAIKPITIYQNDKTPYTLPLSWLDFGMEGGMPSYSMHIPKRDAHIVPKAIIEDVFVDGAVRFEPGKSVNIAKIQAPIVWHHDPVSDQYSPLLFPSEWINKEGDIQIPFEQSEIDKYFSADEIDSIRIDNPFFVPGEIIRVHRGPFPVMFED